MKTILRLTLTFLAFLCLSLVAPKAQAVVPPPDGGYPNFNTAEGQNALFSLTTGAANTAVGWSSLFTDAAGSFNTATGAGALLFNTSDENTAFGAAALLLNATGFRNTAVGVSALSSNTGSFVENAEGDPGSINTAVGNRALLSNTLGSANTAVGASALVNSATGNGNIALGTGAGNLVTTASNVISIGDAGDNVSNSCFIGNIRGVATAQNNAIAVLVDSSGQLGTVSSSRRYKKEIKSMDKTSEAILALKPVTFHYKSDSTNRPEFGLIAEEVAEISPDLVVRDENGEIYTVRYDAVNAMLLNEFLKEHRKVEKLEATVAELVATVKEQASQLEKVSAQVQMNDSAAQVVANNQ